MGFGGATAGLLAGLIVGLGSYAILNLVAACLIIVLLVVVLQPQRLPIVNSAPAD
jgi:hypothetical protein